MFGSLGVELGSVRGVDGEEFVAIKDDDISFTGKLCAIGKDLPNQVRSRLERSWDRAGPAVVVRDEFTHTPLPVSDRATEKAALVDLEPAQAIGVYTRAGGAAAAGQVH